MAPERFWILWLCSLLWVASVVVASVFFRRSRGKPVLFFSVPDAVFQERTASGSSNDRWWRRFGGANNCLVVAVTSDRVVIRPWFPFNLMFLPETYGLEYEIPLGNVRSATIDRFLIRRRVRLTFQDGDRTCDVSLFLRQPEEFVRLVSSGGCVPLVSASLRPRLNGNTFPKRGAMVDAVIFDCDGTLVDSVLLTTQVLVEYLADLGIVLQASDVAARFGDGQLAAAIAEFESFLGRRLPDDFVPELRHRRELAVRARLRPIDGAIELLNALQVPIAVASNGPLRQTRLSLEVTGLVPYFAANVFSAYDIDAWKPDPRLFLHAASALGVDPSRCAVVEDGISGIEAGIAAGMTVFALGRDGPWPSERVRIVKCLDDVRRSLIRFGTITE